MIFLSSIALIGIVYTLIEIAYNFINDIFSKKPTITFKNKEKQEVFNKVIPVFETISKEINIDENLAKNIIKEKPSFEVYFDRDSKKTWATIKAIYGNVNFLY